MPRALLHLVELALVAAAVGFVALAPAPEVRRPNVLLVSIDSLRSDHLHSYGYARETSPTIDALASEGALFRHVVAPTTWTLPSHVTLLTAMPPRQHDVASNSRQLDPAAVTLAEVLQSEGYATAGFIAGPYVRAMYGFGQGFDLYDESIVKKGFAAHRGATSPKSVRVVKRYLDGWDRGGREKPFFVFLHLWDVHYDYDPPPPYDTMFDPDYTGSVSGRNFMFSRKLRPDMARRDLEHLIALYDGEIRYTDDHLGKILDHLRQLGVLDDTIVVVTADHGEEFYEHGRKGHGTALYDETLLVPLVIRYPAKVAAGRVVEQQVRLMDVAPTILQLADVRPPADFGTPAGTPHGAIGLASFVSPRRPSDPPPLVAFSATAMDEKPRSSVRRQQSKLVVRASGDDPYEVYDLVADPGERVNLRHRADRQDLSQGLERQLASWASLWADRPKYAQSFEVPAQQAARLKALGYIR